MAFMAFYKQLESFFDLQKIEDLISSYHQGSLPNAEAVAQLLKNNRKEWERKSLDANSSYLLAAEEINE